MIKTGFTPENIIYTPKNIVSFIAELVSPWKSTKILDPACGSGSFFWKINERTKQPASFTGIDISPDIIEIAEENLEKHDIDYKLLNNDFFEIKDKLEEKYDLIVSQPSFVQLKEASNVGDFKFLNNEFAYLFASLDLLAENGYLLFILPEQKSFFYSDYHFPMREYLLENYSLEGIISLPNDTFYPEATLKTCLFILKNTQQRSKVFFAKYSSDNVDLVLDNFQSSKFVKNLSEGFWVDASALADHNASWTYDHFKSIERLKTKKEKSVYPIKKLSEVVSFKREFDEFEEVMLIPKNPLEDVIFRSEFDDESLEKYFLCIVTDDEVSPQYLKLYLNSNAMKNERNLFSYGTFQRTLNKFGLNSLLIEIPDLKTQNQIVETSNLSDKTYRKINILYKGFKSEIFNYNNLLNLMKEFEEIADEDLFYKNLIWPFATSYHIALKTSADKNTQLENHFKLFESIAAFNSIVLLSALPQDIFHEKKEYIFGQDCSNFERVTFGGWINLYSRLSSIYKTFDKETYQILPFEPQFYKKLANNNVIQILYPISSKRNEKSHGGSMSEIIAQKTICELNRFTNQMFDVLTAYKSLKLIYPTNMEKTSGLYHINAKVLEGNSYDFDEEEIITERDMDTKLLYLYNSTTDERLKLKPELIKLVECPECANWSLYFFNCSEKKQVKYVSYQFEVHDHETPPKTMEEILRT